mmetsp:Transcript_19144/g.13865  ORF Transcript_19144/g.13865 Transcript_19144/m.13865 type:complete len:111 (-) Transcript_19144:142-474(-)|eukprot:CAMPEP_0202978258 /NCGR_PEP_ID=MMETSP1396-20130829/84744_1 /ASSEMBLY_ACC=CAM_ASM_000872 /TAXON_ID= /ORGANISM="Pseudokeronopsis sp., Strain Brazil" /LENGTH=110 /DNA_ID=CAMNT_0049717175 /DNA_START=134 /DNA_END=466 /DNA_ORIENTATION=-
MKELESLPKDFDLLLRQLFSYLNLLVEEGAASKKTIDSVKSLHLIQLWLVQDDVVVGKDKLEKAETDLGRELLKEIKAAGKHYVDLIWGDEIEEPEIIVSRRFMQVAAFN